MENKEKYNEYRLPEEIEYIEGKNITRYYDGHHHGCVSIRFGKNI